MYLVGRVATNDNTAIPNDTVVQRVCNGKVRQQVYAASTGDFNMQLGARSDSVLDAASDAGSQSGAIGGNPSMGISTRRLTNCELQASAAGFTSDVISLVDLDDTFAGRKDVGVIVVQRLSKIAGTTINARSYMAPKEARKAYEKGLEAEGKGNLAVARKHFETAVAIYPKYASAWFQLGMVLQNQNHKDEARKAYTQATASDSKFLPPYLSLAAMALEERNWTAVLALTGHILERDPLNHVEVAAYIVDLDPLNCAEAYFYNAFANFQLNKFDEAERSGLKAEHVDLLTRFPQLHFLLGEIFARKNDYAAAISELRTYLELAPHAKNVDQVRAELAELQKLNGLVSTREKSVQN